jgi:hypothetical protein
MKTCPYCGSNIENINDHKYYCDFCAMNLDFQSVKENGERLAVRVTEAALDVHIDKTTPEIMILSTYELLYLLKAIRKERSNMYSKMNIFYKAGKQENTDEYREYEKITGNDYMYYTKKAFVVENIIRSMLGYVPTRITDTYLLNYLNNIQNDKSGPMIIRTERKKINQGHASLN